MWPDCLVLIRSWSNTFVQAIRMHRMVELMQFYQRIIIEGVGNSLNHDPTKTREKEKAELLGVNVIDAWFLCGNRGGGEGERLF